jgi:virginiamycin A acetyltransferase
MNGANHQLDGFSTYPFAIFGNGWETVSSHSEPWPYKGNTVIGNDVWIGYEATIMPGVQVGDGAIIAAKSVVASDVPAYTIFGGNPARCIRQRFKQEVIRSLLEIAWWNWDIQKITRHLDKIVSADIEALINCE